MAPELFDAVRELARRCGLTLADDEPRDTTRERLRAACMDRDPAIAWRGPTGKPETYAEAFCRAFGEVL